MLTSAVYPAYDLAWQMEELLMEEPDLDKLAACVALLRVSNIIGLCTQGVQQLSEALYGCSWHIVSLQLSANLYALPCAVVPSSRWPLHMLTSCRADTMTSFLHTTAQVFARGSESHVYSALLLLQAYTARVQELDKKVATMGRKTAAMQRRLTQQINQLLAGAELANYIYSEAVPCRWVD